MCTVGLGDDAACACTGAGAWNRGWLLGVLDCLLAAAGMTTNHDELDKRRDDDASLDISMRQVIVSGKHTLLLSLRTGYDEHGGK